MCIRDSVDTGSDSFLHLKPLTMLWQGRRQSTNVDDRRSIGAGGLAVGGGVIGIIIFLLNMFLGGGSETLDPSVIQQLPGESRQLSPDEKARDDQRAEFVKVVLADTEDVWGELFQQSGETY